jgi:DNA-binding response OmpR family regulator
MRILVAENDAAIMDVNLTHPPILEVVRDVRARRQHLPILVLSSRSRPEDRVQVLDVRADDIVLKPFVFSELSARVRALLRRGGRSPETVYAGGRPRTEPRGAQGEAGGKGDRPDAQRIFAAGISDAQCGQALVGAEPIKAFAQN